MSEYLKNHIAQAKQRLPHGLKPWTITRRGVDLLTEDLPLDAYIAAYGEMHMVKCYAALQNFPYDNLLGNCEIVDWGCGQGIASICLLDALKARGLESCIRRITLIEPSSLALQRAKHNIQQVIGSQNIQIVTRNQYLPSSSVNPQHDLSVTYDHVIHLFSNILDIVSVDLKKTAEVLTSIGRNHYVVCTAPVNGNSRRLDEFYSYFAGSTLFSDVNNANYGYTSDTNHVFGCKTKCFSFTHSSISLNQNITSGYYIDENTYDDYDKKALVRNGYITEEFLSAYTSICQKVDEDDIVYIKPEINGEKLDIAILSPKYGLLVVKVFEDDILKYEYKDRDIYLPQDKDDISLHFMSPMHAVQAQKEEIQDFHSKEILSKTLYNKSAFFLVSTTVFFCRNTDDEIRGYFYGKSVPKNVHNITASIISRQDSIWTQLQVQAKGLARNIVKDFKSLLSTNWHSYREGNPVKLTADQRRLVYSDKNRQKIRGVAGCGKTQVLASRAVRSQLRYGKKILILTYNITMVNYLKYRIKNIHADFMWNNFIILNYHSFFNIMARNLHRRIDLHSYGDLDFFAPDADRLPKYSAIFIDEAQDFEESWIKLLDKYFLEEGGELVIFGDDKQDIYHKKSLAQMPIPGRWNEMSVGHRFENPDLIRIANDFQREFFDIEDVSEIQTEQTLFNDYNFKYYTYSKESLFSNCMWLLRDGFDLSDGNTIVLCQETATLRYLEKSYRDDMRHKDVDTTNITFETQEEHAKIVSNGPGQYTTVYDELEKVRRNRKLHFTMISERVKFSTIHSFKGWEADNVILIIPTNSDDNMSNELMYTGLTRTRRNLYILADPQNKYHNFFARHANG